jgi:hypothetical protein
VEPTEVLEVVEAHGKLVVGEKGELMIEFDSQEDVDALSSALKERFGEQVILSP